MGLGPQRPMLLSARWHIPETITGLLGAVLIDNRAFHRCGDLVAAQVISAHEPEPEAVPAAA